MKQSSILQQTLPLLIIQMILLLVPSFISTKCIEWMSSLLSSPYFYPELLNGTGEIRFYVWALLGTIFLALLFTATVYFLIIPRLETIASTYQRKKIIYIAALIIPFYSIFIAVTRFINNAQNHFLSTNDWSEKVYNYVMLYSIGQPFIIGIIGIFISWLIVKRIYIFK